MKNKDHVAWRTCIATGEKKDKREMLRLVKREDNTVVVDLKGKEHGRGANITASVEAFEIAVKKKAIQRALKLTSALSKSELETLFAQFKLAVQEKALRQGNKRITLKISQAEYEQAKKKVEQD